MLLRTRMPDQSRWQRRATGALAYILDRHRELTPLRWTLAPHGCGLTGEITAPDAYTIERVFAEWAAALDLALNPRAHHVRPGRLVASGTQAGCRITVMATIPTTTPEDRPR